MAQTTFGEFFVTNDKEEDRQGRCYCSYLLYDDDDYHNVKEDEKDPGWHVGDHDKTAAEQWSCVKELQKV